MEYVNVPGLFDDGSIKRNEPISYKTGDKDHDNEGKIIEVKLVNPNKFAVFPFHVLLLAS